MPSGRLSLLDVHVDVGVCLQARPLGAIALGVGHGDAEREVFILHAMQIGEETLRIIGAMCGVGALGRLMERVERIMGEIALRAARGFADEPHRFQFREKIGRGLADMRHAVDGLAGRALPGGHQQTVFGRMSEVIGDADGVDAGSEQRLVGDARNRCSVNEHARPIGAQRLAIIGGGHQHGSLSLVL